MKLSREKVALGLAVGLLLALPVLLFLPGLFLGERLWGFDELVVNIPSKVAAQRALAAGEAPLWLPDVLGGLPHIASSNLQFLYPTELISALPGMDIHASFAWDSAFHVFVAGLGMLCFLRSLGLSLTASLLGAVFFALSGSQVSGVFGGYRNFTKATAMLPWAFWGAWVGWRDRAAWPWAVAGGALALQILSVSAQLFVYTATAIALLGAAQVWPLLRRAYAEKALLSTLKPLWAGPALMVLVTALFAAPQLLLTLQYLPLSQRGAMSFADFSAGSFGLAEAVTWIVPGFFGWAHPSYHGAQEVAFMTPYLGLLPWVLAAGGAAAAWQRRPLVRMMLCLASVAFVVAIGPATPLHSLLYRLPIYSGFRISARALMLVSFAVCILAAIGWDALATSARRRAGLTGLAVCAAFAAIAASAYWLAPRSAAAAIGNPYVAGVMGANDATVAALQRMAQNSALRALASLAVLMVPMALLLRKGSGGLLLVLLLAFHLGDQFNALKGFVRFQPEGVWSRPVQEIQAALPSEEAEPWRFYSLSGSSPNDAILLKREALEGRQSMELRSTARMKAAMRERPKDWLNMMGVKWFLSREKGEGADKPGLMVRRDDDALPRARLLGRVRQVADDEEALRLLGDPAFDVRREVALQSDPGPLQRDVSGKVRWLSRTQNTVELEVESTGDAVLLLSNAWYPHWRASRDGQRVPVLRANGGLQAVKVGPGRQALRFWYDPSLFFASLLGWALGLIVFLALLWRRVRRGLEDDRLSP